jgi:hypothetical protein
MCSDGSLDRRAPHEGTTRHAIYPQSLLLKVQVSLLLTHTPNERTKHALKNITTDALIQGAVVEALGQVIALSLHLRRMSRPSTQKVEGIYKRVKVYATV